MCFGSSDVSHATQDVLSHVQLRHSRRLKLDCYSLVEVIIHCKEKLLCELMKPGGFEDNVLMGAKYISMLVQFVYLPYMSDSSSSPSISTC